MISMYKQNMNIHNTFCAVYSTNVNRQTSYGQAKDSPTLTQQPYSIGSKFSK